LIPLVHQPTRGGNTLDRLYVSEECFATVKVLNSAIKTDHRAIVAVPHGPVITRGKVLTRVVYRRRSPPQHAALLRCLSEVDLSALLEASDPQRAWDLFNMETIGRLDTIYPLKMVTMTSTDPPYVTPAIKLLLKKKNRLIRAGRLKEASAYARRVGQAIKRAIREDLSDVDPRSGMRDLWR